ncbi:MAG TPA: tetratricopeptide repeat protein [Stellaceae bacterium]|nr:tetratricopeptide repeat protein [Stellaceae bacterium]
MPEADDLASLRASGLAQQRAGQHKAAIQIFEIVLRRGGGDAALLCRLGESYERIGDAGRADEAYARAIEHDPNFALAYRSAADLALRARAVAARVGQSETAEALRQGAFRYLAALGGRLLGEGAWREAEAEFRHALALAPDDWAARVDLGRALLEQGRAGDAEIELRNGLSVAPGQAMAHFTLGLALRRQGRNDEAEAALRQALALDPGLAAASAELARIAAGRGVTEP